MVDNLRVPSEYRIAPAVTARLIGLLLVGMAVVVFLTTGVVAVLDLHTAVLLVPAALCLVTLVVAAVVVSRRGWVVRLLEEGYQVQWVRGVGVAAARWTDVEDAVTDTVGGSPVLVLRLRSGATSTIPVEMLAADREAFVRDVQQHLQRGNGLRRL